LIPKSSPQDDLVTVKGMWPVSPDLPFPNKGEALGENTLLSWSRRLGSLTRRIRVSHLFWRIQE